MLNNFKNVSKFSTLFKNFNRISNIKKTSKCQIFKIFKDFSRISKKKSTILKKFKKIHKFVVCRVVRSHITDVRPQILENLRDSEGWNFSTHPLLTTLIVRAPRREQSIQAFFGWKLLNFPDTLLWFFKTTSSSNS